MTNLLVVDSLQFRSSSGVNANFCDEMLQSKSIAVRSIITGGSVMETQSQAVATQTQNEATGMIHR